MLTDIWTFSFQRHSWVLFITYIYDSWVWMIKWDVFKNRSSLPFLLSFITSSSFSVVFISCIIFCFFFSARLRLHQKIKNTINAPIINAATIENMTMKGKMYFSKQYCSLWQMVSSQHLVEQLSGPLQACPSPSPEPSHLPASKQ